MRFTATFAFAKIGLRSLVAGSPVHHFSNDTAPISPLIELYNNNTAPIVPLPDHINDTVLALATHAQKLADKSIFICEGRSYGGMCALQTITNGRCINYSGRAKSINQDDKGRARCDIFSFPNCKGIKLTCSGDCPTLFLLEDQMRSLQCFW